jgi:hypothetical protein
MRALRARDVARKTDCERHRQWVEGPMSDNDAPSTRTPRATLRDAQIVSRPAQGRRALLRLGAGAAAAATAAALLPVRRAAAGAEVDNDKGFDEEGLSRWPANTDTDPPPHADARGRGRKQPGIGANDDDNGPSGDPTGGGRSGGRGGITDSDRGPKQDPPGHGRGGS